MELLSGTIDIPEIVLYPVIIGFLLYIYTRYQYSYWRKQGVPAATAWPFIGNMTFMFDRKNLTMHEKDQIMYKKYGKTFGIYEPKSNMLMISDPEDIKTIFVKDFEKFPDRRDFNSNLDPIMANALSTVNGEKWNAIRNVITPTFSASKMKFMINCLIECSEELTDCLIEKARTTKEFDPKRIFGAYTLDVIAGTAFRTKINSMKDPDNEFVQNSKKVFSQGATWRLIAFFIFPKLSAFFKISFLDPKIIEFFANVVRKIIKLRKNEEKTQDFLSLLKEHMEDDAFDDANPHKITSESSNEDGTKESKKFMTENMVLAQCVLFFLAGYDTTATTLSMVAYNLATNPKCQDKLIKEIDETVEKHGKLNYESIGDMPYLKAVLKETLRMYSPAIRLERKCIENYQLGDIFLEKGTLIGVPTYSIHHDPEYWPDPETFDPERFMGDANDFNPYTYLPFGIGRRNCVAMRFAEMEVKVAIATLLTKVKVTKLPTTTIPPKFKKNIGLLQPIDLKLGVEERQEKKMSVPQSK